MTCLCEVQLTYSVHWFKLVCKMRIWCGLTLLGVLVGRTPWQQCTAKQISLCHLSCINWSLFATQNMCHINSLIAGTQITMTSTSRMVACCGLSKCRHQCLNNCDIHGKLLVMHSWTLQWASRSCCLKFKVEAASCIHVSCRIRGHGCLSHCPF